MSHTRLKSVRGRVKVTSYRCPYYKFLSAQSLTCIVNCEALCSPFKFINFLACCIKHLLIIVLVDGCFIVVAVA